MKTKPRKILIGTAATLVAGFAGASAYFQIAQEDPILSNTPASAARTIASDGTVRKGESVEPDEENVENRAKPADAAGQLTHSLSPQQEERLLELLNDGSLRELLKIHGVGSTRAEAIQSARPFETVADLSKVSGIGKITFARVIAHGRQMGEREPVVAVADPSGR